ncbi:uncharacterized protein [Apostichopus japonicus]|uniref:uncharacterized protein n=1 Tax=Stichopus japonicus TaxID=307972 RepID=UPI003AB5E542
MNKFLALCFVAVTVLVVQVQWIDAYGNMFDDFVMFPSLRAKRDLEMEEFFKDGNKHAAQSRAVDRQRRSNEENMSEDLKRVRKSLQEDDEEDGPFNCRAHEMNDMKRATGTISMDPVKYTFKTGDVECTQETKDRFLEKFFEFGHLSLCHFTEAVEAIANIEIACANDGNYAPIPPFHESFKSVNVQEINGVAPRNIISHECLHTCGMWHPHQEEGASALLEIDLDCILPEYWSQYTQVDTAYHTSPTGADICEQSSLMYPPDAFLDPACSVNILSKSKTLPDKAFASYKSIYFHEVKKIRISRNKVCDDESGLESNEYWGGSDGCNVFTFAPTTVENRELAVGSWTDTISESLAPGNTVQYSCSASNFQILELSWTAPNSGKCRGGAIKVFKTEPDVMDSLMFQCGSTDTDTTVHSLNSGEKFVADTSSIGSGGLDMVITCSD